MRKETLLTPNYMATKYTKKHNGHKENIILKYCLGALCVSFVAFVTFY
jgi:hypothetical protein